MLKVTIDFLGYQASGKNEKLKPWILIVVNCKISYLETILQKSSSYNLAYFLNINYC